MYLESIPDGPEWDITCFCLQSGVTLVDLQLDAQNSYLFTYNIFINILYRLTGAQDSHLQTVTIPEAAYIQLRRRPPEDEQGNARNM